MPSSIEMSSVAFSQASEPPPFVAVADEASDVAELYSTSIRGAEGPCVAACSTSSRDSMCSFVLYIKRKGREDFNGITF